MMKWIDWRRNWVKYSIDFMQFFMISFVRRDVNLDYKAVFIIFLNVVDKFL